MGTEPAFRPEMATFTTTPGDVTIRFWIAANVAYVRDHPPARVKR